MPKEYIEREAALRGVNEFYHEPKVDIVLRQIPAADVVEVKHGKWNKAEDGDGVVCSCCECDFCILVYETEKFNYCPNCGAKMDGERRTE